MVIELYLAIINVLGFTLMGIDKHRAKRLKWRISEKRLIFIACVGGSIGIYWGMRMWRHKTQHMLFKIAVPVIFAIQLGIYTYVNL